MRLSRSPIRPELRPQRPGEGDLLVPPSDGVAVGPASEEDGNDGGENLDADYVLAPARLASPVLSFAIAIGIVVLVLGLAALVAARVWSVSPLALFERVFPVAETQLPLETSDIAASSHPPPPATPAGTIPSRAWALWKSETPDLLASDALTPRPFQQSRIFPPGFDMIDGATLQADDVRIHLSGIVSLPPGAICVSDQMTKFACGLMARASLSVFTTGEKLVCYPDVSIETDKPKFLCRSHGRDVALAQIAAGFVLPATRSIVSVNALVAKAREDHAGAWNGGWTIIPPGGAPVNVPNKSSVQ